MNDRCYALAASALLQKEDARIPAAVVPGNCSDGAGYGRVQPLRHNQASFSWWRRQHIV